LSAAHKLLREKPAPRPPGPMLRFINRLLGRHQNTLPPFDLARNRFRVKKKWPPTFSELTDKQKFRFERKFKRRIKAKSTNPLWNKWTKIAQWSLISFVAVYGVLFHDFRKDPNNPRLGEQPFEGLRARMWEILGNFYTHSEGSMAIERGGQRRVPQGGPERSLGGEGEEEGKRGAGSR